MTLRRTVQIVLFLLFLFLLFATTFQEKWDGLNPALPVDLFLRLDPLAMLGTSLAERQWVKGVFLLLPLIIATVFFGRIFCGWICPLGTTLDLFEKLVRSPNPKKRHSHLDSLTTPQKLLPRLSLRSKYYLLFALLAAAALGIQATWIADPIPIVTRSFAIVVFPAAEWSIRLFGGVAQRWSWSADAYRWTQDNVLTFHQPYFLHSFLALAVFLFILLMSLKGRRWWCRKLCPLGAFLGLLSQWKPLGIQTTAACAGCGECSAHCKMEAIEVTRQDKVGIIRIDNRECIMCSTCIEECPKEILGYQFTMPQAKPDTVVNLPRRRVTAALAAGVVLAPAAKLDFSGAERSRAVLRPPNIGTEEEFLNLCIRCGECMKVCLTNALQPAFLEAGYFGVFSPIMIPRQGYCAYDCSLCGQVCPTGAIPYFTPERKHGRSQGLAAFDRGRCIPYAENRDCLVCEEHCPASPKAIVFVREEVLMEDGSRRIIKRPFVRSERCVGCGICENKCPVTGPAAVQVYPYSPQRSLHEIRQALPRESVSDWNSGDSPY